MDKSLILKQFLVAVVAIYCILCFFSVPTANFVLALFLVTIVPLIIFKAIFLNILYKHSINIVPKSMVIRKNTIQNSYCTVSYTPDSKIVVMDSYEGNQMVNRIFSISNKDIDINRTWNRVCRIFDNYTTLDTLSAFFGCDCGLRVVTTEITKTKKDANENSTQVKEVNIVTNKPQKRKEAPIEFVDMNNLQEQEIKQEEKFKEHESFEMNEIMTKMNKKIDINSVEAGELAILPGINIAMAKKLIEYRNLNGIFKTEQEFFEVANLKDHFKNKVKDMIVVLQPETDKDDENQSEGRIVDI